MQLHYIKFLNYFIFKSITLNSYYILIIAKKCVKLTGYGPNFNLERDYDYINILTNSSSYTYFGNNGPVASTQTTASLVGIISEELMVIIFKRYHSLFFCLILKFILFLI